jgi:S-adenosylmethionine decarboxylase
MVKPDVPGDFTLSPTQGTPQLTINHDVAADLDSSNAFEGPEKLLEVWFAPGPSSLPSGASPEGLKAVPSDAWVHMLDLVNCKILSVVRSDHVDAYLLSESSMFVFPHKIILKTCGTTTLLLGLHRLLHIAATEAGFPFHNATALDDIHAAATPYRVFYSRKNFLFPDKQQGPHRSWKQEVKYLDDMFEGGSAYMVGKMNGDHWYLYITSPNETLTPPRTPDGSPTRHTKIPAGQLPLFQAGKDLGSDETLEILMTDLDPEHAKQFYLSHASAVASERMPARVQEARKEAHESLGGLNDDGSEAVEEQLFNVDDCTGGPTAEQAVVTEALTTEGHALGTVVSDVCGLSDVYPKAIYPDARIDAYMFSPCGFSANGVVPAPAPASTSDPSARAEHYFTVHVTPEPACSFASFETNVPGGQKGRTTVEIIEHVVGIFRPGRFSVTLFEAKRGASGDLAARAASDSDEIVNSKARVERIKGYRRIDRIVHDFEDYDLIFRYYERDGWVGDGGARVGEI